MCMKELLLLRHAEAESPQLSVGDRARKLTMRGQQQASELAEKLLASSFRPDKVLVSSAMRTRETLERLRQIWPLPESAILDCEDLYLAGFDQVLARLAAIETAEQKLLLIGHNPGWSDIACQLTNQVFGLTPCQALWLTYPDDDQQRQDWVSAFTDLGRWQWQPLV